MAESLMTDVCRPVINLKQGAVCGTVEKLPSRKSFYSFKGIPYAEPPLGALRFEVQVLRQRNIMCYADGSHRGRLKNSKKISWIAAENATSAFIEIS